MKTAITKLFSSPKFWAINWAIAVGTTLYHFFGDDIGLGADFPMLVVGAFTSIGLFGAGKDIVKEYRKNGNTVNKEL